MLWRGRTLESSDEDEYESQIVLEQLYARSVAGSEAQMELRTELDLSSASEVASELGQVVGAFE